MRPSVLTQTREETTGDPPFSGSPTTDDPGLTLQKEKRVEGKGNRSQDKQNPDRFFLFFWR